MHHNLHKNAWLETQLVFLSSSLRPHPSLPSCSVSRYCIKDRWSLPVTSVGTLPSSLDRKITLFRENNTLILPRALPDTRLALCVHVYVRLKALAVAVNLSTKDHFIWLVCISEKHTEQKAQPQMLLHAN